LGPGPTVQLSNSTPLALHPILESISNDKHTRPAESKENTYGGKEKVANAQEKRSKNWGKGSFVLPQGFSLFPSFFLGAIAALCCLN